MIVLREALPGEADGLAGEASRDDVDGFELARVEGRDVAIAFYLRPMLREHALAPLVVLHLPAHPHARLLEAEVDAADAGEERAYGQGHAKSNPARAVLEIVDAYGLMSSVFRLSALLPATRHPAFLKQVPGFVERIRESHT